MIKLNLGCGNKRIPGYINCDMPGNYSGVPPDLECDVRKISYPNDSVDEILAVHLIEHFYIWEVIDVLSEWKRVLKPGGLLILELPDLEKILMNFNSNIARESMTFWGLYGDPKYKNPSMCHRWAYTQDSMRSILETVGFKDIIYGQARFHVPSRDMRITAKC